MKNKKTFLTIILAFALLMGGATVLYGRLGAAAAADRLAAQDPSRPEEEAPAEPQAPPKAPDFIVYDAEGEEVRLSDYEGKPVVLNFWASWCGPCRSEMPDFHEKYLELGDEVHFLMVNRTGGRESMNSAMAFLEENAYTFPVVYDTEANAASAYGAYSLPTTFFIDAEGYAVAQATGAIDAETLQKGIDMIL